MKADAKTVNSVAVKWEELSQDEGEEIVGADEYFSVWRRR